MWYSLSLSLSFSLFFSHLISLDLYFFSSSHFQCLNFHFIWYEIPKYKPYQFSIMQWKIFHLFRKQFEEKRTTDYKRIIIITTTRKSNNVNKSFSSFDGWHCQFVIIIAIIIIINIDFQRKMFQSIETWHTHTHTHTQKG